MTAPDAIDFDAADLASHIENLSQHELNHLPFGVILLDLDGMVRFYSESEGRQSGYDFTRVMGHNFWQVAPCFDNAEFRGRIETAYAASPKVDLEIGWVGDFTDPLRELRIRIQSARSGGFWIFIQRDRKFRDTPTG